MAVGRRLETEPQAYIYSHLIYDKGSTVRKGWFLNGQLNSAAEKKMNLSPLHKNQFQVEGRSKCERLNDKASRK